MKIKVGAAALNQTPLDWNRNTQNIINAIQSAKQAGVKILCLPELAITGYGCEDHFLSEEVNALAWEECLKIVKYTDEMFVCLGLPVMYCNALYNAMVCVYDGKIVGIVPKQHLAGDGLHYEPRWFKPWPAGLAHTLFNIPIGDLTFHIDGMVIGFEICEDAFVAGRPGNDLARRGVNIILNPSASHFEFEKKITRERLVIEGSRAFNSIYIYSNLLGNEAGRAIYDGDCLIANCGELIARGPFLNMSRVTLTTAVVDISKTITKAVSTASFSPDLQAHTNGNIHIKTYSSLACTTEKNNSHIATTPTYDCYQKYEEFIDAVTLGLSDYLEKSHSRGFVISLSGGADSAACTVLAHIMIRRWVYELGLEDVLDRFPFLRDIELNTDQEEQRFQLTKRLITCVYQATTNSSDTTLAAAESVANEFGVKFAVINIDSIVKQYTLLAESIEGRPINWELDDLALQNIQARTRAPSIWMVANIEQKLLITTSNRSEAAVGYCTMDGDTAGSIAPIGGVDKAFLIEWLKYMTVNHSSLQSIVCQKPTAELRPGLNQTDEDDLMPYNILDAIETWAIREKKGPQEVLDCLDLEMGIDRNIAAKYVRKFFTLWVRNQWKRERYAASFHLDNHNLDPKTWCRFPILSGGFDMELKTLKV